MFTQYRGNGGKEVFESQCNYLIKYFDSEAKGRIVYFE